MKFEELQKQIEDDFNKTDEYDLGKEVLRNDNLFGKYIIFLKDEKIRLAKIEAQLKKMIFFKKQYYSGQLSDEYYQEHPLDKRYIKTELGDVLNSDEDIIKLNEMLSNSALKVTMIEGAIKRIDRRGFDLKTAVDYLKFTQGV
jgi:hypothetical protein